MENIENISAHDGIEKQLRYSLHSIDHDKPMTSGVTIIQFLDIIRQNTLTPYQYWVAIYDEGIREPDGSPAILTTLNMEEWFCNTCRDIDKIDKIIDLAMK